MTNNHISNIENGYTVPSLETLLKICHALDVTPDYLLLGSTKENPSQNIIDNLSLCSKSDIETIEKITEIFVQRNKQSASEQN